MRPRWRPLRSPLARRVVVTSETTSLEDPGAHPERRGGRHPAGTDMLVDRGSGQRHVCPEQLRPATAGDLVLNRGKGHED